MIHGMFDSGAMPVLQRVVQFTSTRHRVLANNIANLSTPYFKPTDLDVEGFQDTLRKAIDERRAGANPNGPLNVRDTQQLRFGADRIDTRDTPSHDGVLFHDQNNRDLERTMQKLAENTMTHNAALEMLRSELAVLQTAIRGRL